MADDRMCLGPISFRGNLHFWDITETGLRLQLLDGEKREVFFKGRLDSIRLCFGQFRLSI